MLFGFALLAFDVFFVSAELTWERYTTYAISCLASIGGAAACANIWLLSGRPHPSVFLLSIFYEKVALGVLSFVLAAVASDFLELPEWLLFGLLIPSVLAITVSNVVLIASLWRAEVLEVEADWLPFRSLLKRRRP